MRASHATPLMRRQADAGMLASDRLHPYAAALAEWAAQLVSEIEVAARK